MVFYILPSLTGLASQCVNSKIHKQHKKKLTKHTCSRLKHTTCTQLDNICYVQFTDLSVLKAINTNQKIIKWIKACMIMSGRATLEV
jgi:hypothetical protein